MSQALRVLIVDDSEDDALLVANQIEEGGYGVDYLRVDTGEAMRAALGGRPWDAITCDVHMPSFDPFQALAAYKESGMDSPFIVVSGVIGEENAVSLLKAGAHDFVLKGKMSRLVPALEREMREVAVRREKRHAEQALRRSTETLESVISALPVALFVVAADGKVEMWNTAAQTILGYTSDEMVGRALPADLFEGDPASPDGPSPPQRLAQGRTVRAEETRCLRRDGTMIDVSVWGASLHPAQTERRRIILVLEDISQHKAMAAQLLQAQKMEAAGQLVGGIAHDFNNLLGVAIGNLDLASERVETDRESAELIEAVLHSLERGTELVKSLLAFARRQPLRPARLYVGEFLAASTRLLRRMLGEHIEVRFAASGDLWPVVVDRSQLDTAVTNLAINARDAMPQGGRLGIELCNAILDEDYAAQNPDVSLGDYVRISISDTGHGMPPEVVARAFEPFFTTKEAGKGTGLGLSMVYGFIKQSGGHIKVYSEVGVGTTVKLYLPRADEREEVMAIAAPQEEIPRGSEVILLVEDDADVRKMAARQLHSLGYRLVEAADAVEALQVLGAGVEVDLLFTDVVMPHGMSGFDLAKETARLRPGLPVLFTSGFPGTMLPTPEGGAGLLSKPYRKRDLARAIRVVLNSRPQSGG